MKKELKKGRIAKRLLSLLLALAMVVTLMPVTNMTAKAEEAYTPLTFTAQEANSTVKLTWYSGSDFYYKYNDGAWTAYTSGTELTLENKGDTISFKGMNFRATNDSMRHSGFTLTGKLAASGDVTSLINGKGGNVALTETYCFYYLFCEADALTSAPNLPSTTLAGHCYDSMFIGCTSLKEAPSLPATDLVVSCYNRMFQGCTSLVGAPELNAEKLSGYCYARMFNGCISLTKAPKLKATTLAESCYQEMFYGCTSLTVAPALSATSLASYCYEEMFYGCTSLKVVPALSATSLASYCYYRMFYGCTELLITETSEADATWNFPNVSDFSLNYAMDMVAETGSAVTLASGKSYKVTAKTYTVTYDANGGKFSDGNTTRSEDLSYYSELSSTHPTIDGYAFKGWYDAATGGNAITNLSTKAAATYYAQWTEKSTLSASDFTFAAPTSTRGAASVTTSKAGVGTLTLYYSSDNGSTWTTTVPSKEGSYRVAVKAAEGTAYKKTDYITDSSWTFTYGHINTTNHAKVDATCTTAGVKEYWTCDDCGAKVDKNGNIVADADLVIAAGHTLTKVAAVSATTTSTGNKEYYECSVCGKLFLDSTGTTETTLANVTIAKLTETSKKTNPMKLKATSKTFKASSLKKKKTTVTISFSKKAQGKVTYTLSSSAKSAGIKVSSNGKITIPKKCKKGTYKIAVKAAGNSKYKAVSKTFTVKVK